MTDTATQAKKCSLESVREFWNHTVKVEVIDRLGLKVMLSDEKHLPPGAHGPLQAQVPVRVEGCNEGSDGALRLSLDDVRGVVEKAHKDTRDFLTKTLRDHKYVCFHPQRCLRMTGFVRQPDTRERLARVLMSFVRVSERDVLAYKQGRVG